MKKVSILQLWGKAWELFKVNRLPLVGLLLLSIGVSFIPFVGGLISVVIFFPALVRAGYLVARQGQVSFGEAFGDFGALIKVFVYHLSIWLVPGVAVGLGIVISAKGGMLGSYEASSGGPGAKMVDPGMGFILAGLFAALMQWILGWAGPYFILSGKASILKANRQSISLTRRHFGTVLLGILSAVVLAILGAIPCGLGLLVVVPVTYVFMPLMYLALAEEG